MTGKNTILVSAVLLGAGGLLNVVQAQDSRPNRGQVKARIIEQFDVNGNGELDADERSDVRAFFQEQRGGRDQGRSFGRGPRGRNAAEEVEDNEEFGDDGARGSRRGRDGGKGHRGRGGHRRGPGGTSFDRSEILAEFDLNEDGELDEAERENLHEEMQARREEAMLERFDENGDGELSEDELAEARESHRGRGHRGGPRDRHGKPPFAGDRDALLEEFDSNGDGELDEEERIALHEEMQSRRVEAMLERFNENGDGQISDDERGQGRRGFRGQKGRSGHRGPGTRGRRS
jgi:Ca2+-binding EF-hand superfamily protein